MAAKTTTKTFEDCNPVVVRASLRPQARREGGYMKTDHLWHISVNACAGHVEVRVVNCGSKSRTSANASLRHSPGTMKQIGHI